MVLVKMRALDQIRSLRTGFAVPVEGTLGAMRRAALSFLALLALAGCQRGTGETEAWTKSPFGRDVDRICNAESRSGAGDNAYANRDIQAAMWLGQNIESQEGRDLLASLSPLPPPEKARKLDEAAKTAGLTAGCPTARAWSP
jgi:hypothetical protein